MQNNHTGRSVLNVMATGSKRARKPPDLCEDKVLGAAAVQAQDEADGLEELLDAGPELLLLHPAGGPRVQDAGLDNELEEVLQGLPRRRRGPGVERSARDRKPSVDYMQKIQKVLLSCGHSQSHVSI